MNNKPLTKRQIAVLSIMAGKAYKRIQSQGCPLPSLRDWRHDEVLGSHRDHRVIDQSHPGALRTYL